MYFPVGLCSELSWPLDVVPNAHSIGLHAVQTSTPRNADCMLPALKTPATGYNSYFQASAADERHRVWQCEGRETEARQEHQADSNQFIPQPYPWSDENGDKNYMPNNTLRQADFQEREDDATQYLHVHRESPEHFTNEEAYDVDAQSGYVDVHYGQTVMDPRQPVHKSHTCPVEYEHNNNLFTCAHSQQNEYGLVLAEHQWNQQMYELEQEDVTDVGQLQTGGRNYHSADTETEHPYGDSHRDANVAGQPQWPTVATFDSAILATAHPDYNSLRTSTGFENNMLSTWPRANVTVAPSKHMSSRSPTKFAGVGDDDFGSYRVQYRQQGREQFHHTVSAAGDGCQKITAGQIDAQTAAPNTVPERLQQAFLQSGNRL